MDKVIRVIPKLEIKGPNLIKGIHLEGLRVLGDPQSFAKHYYEDGADELIYMDIVASLYNRNTLHGLVERTANEIFIPLTVSGGIRTVSDIQKALHSGADKVGLNTGAIRNPLIIKKAAQAFGSSTITVSIEVVRQTNGQYLAYTDNGREYTGVEVVSWAKRSENLGAGEILLTSIDKDGTGSGFDIELIREVSNAVNIPVIASGGAGKVEDIVDVIKETQADGIALASILHYGFFSKCRYTYTPSEGNIDFLRSDERFLLVKPLSIKKIKDYLVKLGITCRLR